MPVNETPCSSCKFFKELRSPMPGESWNRCSHKERRIETKYPCDLNSYGYAYDRCKHYQEYVGLEIVTFIKSKLFGVRHEK